MYRIGLIDDETEQLKAIRRTIKTNARNVDAYDFKSYVLSENQDSLVQEVFAEVMKDISEQRLACLIVDYKIMVRTTKIKGTDIFGKIKDEVPKFPIIILTEVVEESMEPEFIDADKVYKKREFFKLESEYSKEKVANIFDSMRKYVSQRDSLELTLKQLKQQFTAGVMGSEVISNILDLESRLDDFVPLDQTQIDKVFDENKAREIVGLIEKANKLLE